MTPNDPDPTATDPFEELKLPAPESPSSELSRSIQEECTRKLEPARGMDLNGRVAVSAFLSLSTIGLIAWMHQLGTVLWALVLVGVLLVGFARPPGQRVSFRVRWLFALGMPAAFLIYLAAQSSHQLPFYSFWHEQAGLAANCFIVGFSASALVSFSMFLLWYRTDPINPGLSGALIGLCGGLAGAVGVGVGCPNHEAWHLWLGHGCVVVVLSLVGWLAGRRLLSP